MRCHGQLSSCTMSGKTNDLILGKFSNRRTDRQMEKSDFIRRCLTNLDRPIKWST